MGSAPAGETGARLGPTQIKANRCKENKDHAGIENPIKPNSMLANRPREANDARVRYFAATALGFSGSVRAADCGARLPVASSAACVRLATWRRLMICFTCALTVLSDIVSASAMSLFDLPCAIRASTSRWRRVSSDQG